MIEMNIKDVLSKKEYDNLVKLIAGEGSALNDLEEKLERSFKRRPRTYKS